MGLAIALGIVVGAAGYVPYVFAKRQSRNTDPSKPLGYTGWFFFAILVSFVVLFAGIAVCAMVAREFVLPFAIAEVAALFALVIVFGLVKPKLGS